jgi:hypothetical protein
MNWCVTLITYIWIVYCNGYHQYIIQNFLQLKRDKQTYFLHTYKNIFMVPICIPLYLLNILACYKLQYQYENHYIDTNYTFEMEKYCYFVFSRSFLILLRWHDINNIYQISGEEWNKDKKILNSISFWNDTKKSNKPWSS